jgi:hypothetical protein
MKKLLLIVSALTLLSPVAVAQWGEEEMSDKPSLSDRIFTGGGFGASFSNYYDFVSVSPMIGYKITPKLAAGIQIQYRYTKYKQTIPKTSTNDYGLSPFVRYFIYAPFFVHAEYEYLSYQYPLSNGEKKREGYSSFLAGGGFFQPLGRSAGFYALALYNFSYKDPTPYEPSPYDRPLIIRAGVTVGF